MYADHIMTIASLVHPYLASGYAVNNLGRMAQPPGGLRHIPPGMSFLTNNSLQSMRQQMDESNHEMVNMLTHQIDTMLNPIIQNTNHSY